MAKDALDHFIQMAAEYTPERLFFPSSLLSVNEAIDNSRGFQSGRMLDIVGAESTGKSTLALDLIANAQRLYPDKICSYADVEYTFDSAYAEKLGVDCSKLALIHADTAENFLTMIERQSRRGASIIVVDSITFLVPESHNEDDIDDPDALPDYAKSKKIAALGSLISDFVKRMTPIVAHHNTLLVFINQYRANFSTMSRQDKKPYGPWVYRHGLTWRLELARVENNAARATVELKVTKNKLGTERGITKYDLIYGQGLDIKGDLLKHAVEREIVRKSGAWYYFNDTRAQGLENACATFDFDVMKEQLYAMERCA